MVSRSSETMVLTFKYFIFWIFLLCSSLGMRQHHQFACVKNCRCNRQKQIVHCSNEGLTKIVKFSPFVKTLVLDDNRLTALDFDKVLNDTHEQFVLTELSLRRNNITSAMLKSNSFHKFGSLRFLHLDGNRLTYLAEGLLDNNPQLERLTLSDNPLLVHDESAMTALMSHSLAISLKHLDLSRTLNAEQPGNLPSFLSNMTALEELILQNSYIKNTTDDAFSPLHGLRNFKHLDLSGSAIEFIHSDSFELLKNIVELDLSGAKISNEAIVNIFQGLNNSNIEVFRAERIFVGNTTGIKVVHDIFHQLNASKLRVLNFDGNFMAFRNKLPERLLHTLHHLNDLFLESCNLMSIPAHALQGLNSLKKLSLRNNLLSCIRGSECQFLQGFPLKHLRHLDLSYNRFSDTENSVTFRETVFPALEYLDLRFNNLVSVGNNMFEVLTNLVQLDLSNNPIEEIEQNSFRYLSSLTILNLEGCKHLIRLKHGALNGLSSLRVLNLRESGLTHVHHTALSHLSHLEELYLRGNKFSESKDQLQNVTILKSALKILDIGENGLENVPCGLVSNSFELVTLNADGNRIRDCNEFKSLGATLSLETLDLSHNQFAHVSKECFESFSNLKSLDLSGNPFACTCSALETNRWLLHSGLVDADFYGYRCASPTEKINENIFRQPSSLECQSVGGILLICFLVVSLVVIMILSMLYCALRKKVASSVQSTISQSHSRFRAENSSSFYSPLDEDDASKASSAFDTTQRQAEHCNDECHYFENDHQRQALVDREDCEETKIFRGRTSNGFFGKYKRARSKKPYINSSNANKSRSPSEQESSRALSKLGDNAVRCSKISSLGTIDRKSVMLEVTSTNSLDCDIHLEDSVL